MSNSQLNIGPKPIGAIEESDDDNPDEFLGFLTFSTTGDVEVSRDWLLDAFEEYGVSKRYLPRDPTNWMAYRRAIRNLVGPENKRFEVHNEQYGYTHECKFRLEKSEQHGSNVFLMYVDTFWPEELVGEDDWREQKVGRFNYHDPEEGEGALLHISDLERGEEFYDEWASMCDRARNLFRRYQTHHIDADLQKMLQLFRSHTNAVEIRRSVYFIPNHYQEDIEGLSGMWNDMDGFKEGGEDMRIETTPVVNLESQRELVASRAREAVESIVENIVEEMFDGWDEEETSDEVARELLNELGDELGGSVSEYNRLLQTKMSVKNILKDQMEEMKEDEQEVIETALEQEELEL